MASHYLVLTCLLLVSLALVQLLEAGIGLLSTDSETTEYRVGGFEHQNVDTAFADKASVDFAVLLVDVSVSCERTLGDQFFWLQYLWKIYRCKKPLRISDSAF